MDLRQLQALVAVADHGTFSAAADALATVQSNVSAHIARLERELGATLVDRGAGRLTEEGLAVVERARRIEAELEALTADVASLRSDVTGRTRVGIIGTTARWLLPPLLEELEARHPHVDLEVVDATSRSLEPQLLNGRLDVTVVNLPLPNPDLTTRVLFEEDLVLFVPVGHPLATKDHLSLADLAGVELLLPPRGTSFREVLDEAAHGVGIEFTTRAEVDGIRLAASLVIAGHSSAILPATAIPPQFRAETHLVAIEGLPRRVVGVAQRRRGLPSAPARAFLAVLDDVGERHCRSEDGLHLP